MTKLIGILNLTPDSFSDGGAHTRPDTMARALEDMIAGGAYAVDVGAESTRPGATPVEYAEEWARLEPFFSEVWPEFQGKIVLSVDTRHPQTAERALSHGAQWINDVSGFAAPEMVKAVLNCECTLVTMHALTVPADTHVTLPEQTDPMAEILRFFEARVAELEASGVARARIVLDPGIGFGKTAAQSWALVRRIGELKALELPLLVGHSRKSFLGGDMSQRDIATLEVSRQLMAAGVDYLRVHDVAGHAALL